MAMVLVVDDVAANRDIASMMLSYRGHEVIEASEGAEALHLTHELHPDLIISDVLMPGIDGYELVRMLRTDPDRTAAHTPVIFYTANYLEPEARPIAEACGVTQVVLRSADPRTLLDTVDEALRHGPVVIPDITDDEFARDHLHAVNTTLIGKVRELHDTERRFQAMAEASPVGIALIDPAGSATYVNPRLAEITGLPIGELRRDGWLGCVSTDVRSEVLDLVTGHTAPGSSIATGTGSAAPTAARDGYASTFVPSTTPSTRPAARSP